MKKKSAFKLSGAIFVFAMAIFLLSTLMAPAGAVTMANQLPTGYDDNYNPHNYVSTDGNAADGADYPERAYDTEVPGDAETYAVFQNNDDTCDFTGFGTFHIPDNATFNSVTVSLSGYNTIRNQTEYDKNPCDLRDLYVSIAPDGTNFSATQTADLDVTADTLTLIWNYDPSYTDWTAFNFNNNLEVRISSVTASWTNAYISDLTVTVDYTALNTTVGAGSYNKPYDGNPHSITVTASADSTIKYRDTAGNYTLDIPPMYTDVGDYLVYFQVTRPYYDTYTYGLYVHITPATPTVNWTQPASITYGTALTAAEALGVDGSTPVTGTFSYQYSTDGGSTYHAVGSNGILAKGTYLAKAVFTSGDGNYINVSSELPVSVNPAPLTITATGPSKTYGEALTKIVGSTANFTYSATVNGERVTAVDLRPNNNGKDPAREAGKGYRIFPENAVGDNGFVAGNYDIDYVYYQGYVTPATLTVTADNASKAYGDPNPAFTYTLTGFQNGEDATSASVNGTPTLICTATTATPVSLLPVPIAVTDVSGMSAPNYVFVADATDGQLTINPKAASVTPDATGKYVGAADPALTGTLNGFLAADNVTATYSRTAGEAAGTYTISAKLSPAGVLSNYAITYNTANFIINPPYAPPSNNNQGGGGEQATAAGGVELDVTTSGNTTTITALFSGNGSLDDETLQTIIGTAQDFGAAGYGVIVDLSFPESTGNPFSYTIDAAQLADLADNTDASLKLSSPIGSVRFDAAAVDSLADQAGGDDVTVTISKLTAAQLAAYPGYESRTVFDISVSAGGTKITSFGGGEATVTLPYTPTQAELDAGIVIYYMSSSGPVMVTDCMYDAETGTVSFVTNHLSVFAVGYVSAALKDDEWYTEYFNYLEARGIMDLSGFSPDTNITRAQFVTILAAIDGADLSGYRTATFDDVKSSDAYFGAVEWAADNGIIEGYEGLFSPAASITRQDICTILMRYADYVGFLLPQAFDSVLFNDDTDIASYAAAAVSAMQQAGILDGFPGGSFQPTSNTTQAQAAKIFTVFMQLMIEY